MPNDKVLEEFMDWWQGLSEDQRQLETLSGVLRRFYPHGHPDFIPTTLAEMELHSRKNRAYAQGGSPLGNFTRRAAIAAQYPGLDFGNPVVVAVWDAFKQLDCALWQLCQKYEDDVEGLDARLGDGSIYLKIARIIAKERKAVHETRTANGSEQ